MARTQVAEPRHDTMYHNGCTASDALPIAFKIAKQQIPIFEAKCSPSDPMKRQEEFELWLCKIEIVIPEEHGETRIKVAKTQCQGHAESIIKGGQFSQYMSWEEFREAFKG